MQHMHRPLRLSACFHEVLMATSAFKHFKHIGGDGEQVLWVLHDAVKTLGRLTADNGMRFLGVSNTGDAALPRDAARPHVISRCFDAQAPPPSRSVSSSGCSRR
eukprot:SAG11_NODE_1879_length_4130_cov_3.133466_3_plen_104_part_00